MILQSGKYTPELPFIGREVELKILGENLKSALNYQNKCIVIVGESGIGKTRLINKFVDDNKLHQEAINIQITQRTSPNSLFIEVINNYLHKSKRSVRELIQVISRDIYDEYAEHIPELKLYFPFEPRPRKTDLFKINYQLIEFIKNLSNFTPVILVLEDLHNGDNDILNILQNIIHNINSYPVLIILTAQPYNNIHEWLKNLKSIDIAKLSLTPLTQEEVYSLNSLLFDKNLDRKFFYWLWENTRGNPLFLREYLYTLIEKGVIYFDDKKNRWSTLPNYEKIPIFDGIPEILKIRFAGLNKREKNFLKLAAIIGERFSLPHPLLKINEESLNNILKKGFLKIEDKNYSFVHPFIREVIYNNIPEKIKKNIHKKLSQYFKKKGDRISSINHLLKAETKEKLMIGDFIKASIESEKIGNFTQARVFIEQAYQFVQRENNLPIDKRLEITEKYANMLLKIGIYQEAIKICSEYLKLSIKKNRILKKDRIMRLYEICINSLVRAGNYQIAIEKADEAVRLQKKFKILGAEEELFAIMTYKAFALKYLGETEKALKLALELKNNINTQSSLNLQYRLFYLLGSIFNSLGDYTKAIEHRKQALVIAERLKNPSLISSAKGNLGISYINNGEFKKGEELLLEHKEYSQKTGMVREQIMSCLGLGSCYLYEGFLDRAIQEFENGINLCKDSDNQADLVWLFAYLGIALLFNEEYKKAEEYLSQGLELARKLKNKSIYLKTMVYKGLTLYILNKFSDLKLLFEEVKREFSEQYSQDGLYYLLSGVNSIANYKNGFNQIGIGLELLEQKKDYPEFLFVLYFCTKFLKNNPNSKKHLEKAKSIAQRFGMIGWIKRLEGKDEKDVTQELRIFTLGRLRFETPMSNNADMKLLNWQKLRDFFSILITNKFKNKQMTRDEIGALLWPELSKKQVTNNFHVCLAQLKKIFGKDYIKYDNQTYFLNNVWIDAIEFQNLISYSRDLLSKGKIHTAEDSLKMAISLYKGRFLEDCYHTYIEETRNTIQNLYRNALISLSEIYLRKLRFEEAIEIGEKILSLDPLDEEGHRLLMRIYLLNNEKAKAINQYEKCYNLFKKEFGCEPSEETRKFYEEIKSR